MPYPFIILAVLVAIAMFGSSYRKASGASASRAMRDELEVAPWAWALIGVLEAAAGCGIAVGFGVAVVGLASAAGVGLLMVGALAANLRVGLAGRALIPPFVVGVAGAFTAVGFASA